MKTQCTPGQPFGGNDIDTYKKQGLISHTGIDSQCGYGTPINSYWDKEYVYKVLTKENPSNDGSGFTGIFTIVEQDGLVFEFLYGHCDPNPGLLGTTITKGQFIGREANNGEVYSGADGNLRITLEMQKSGDTRGAHRHDQARELRKDKTIQPNTRYLTALGGGYFNYNGYFYAIPNWDNGHNGCYDWTKDRKDNSKYVAMKLAVKDFQLSQGIQDFTNETDPMKINIGTKTLAAIKNYRMN